MGLKRASQRDPGIKIDSTVPRKWTDSSDVRGHGHAAGNVSTFFNSKSGNCLARRLSAVSVAKTHPKVFGYAYSN